MPDTYRLFIAVDLSDEAREAIRAAQSKLLRGLPHKTLRATKIEGVHVTLKFLGDVPVKQVEAVSAGLTRAAAGHRPFDLALNGAGCFPNTRRPRVAWIGLDGGMDQLGALRDAVEEHIAPLGYPTEDRPFSPHVTLGRVERGASIEGMRAVGRGIEGLNVPDVRWAVDEVHLIRSDLKPGGAVYTTVRDAALG